RYFDNIVSSPREKADSLFLAEGRDIETIADGVSRTERFMQTFPCGSIHATTAAGLHNFMTGSLEMRGDLASARSGRSENDDFHIKPTSSYREHPAGTSNSLGDSSIYRRRHPVGCHSDRETQIFSHLETHRAGPSSFLQHAVRP